MNESTQLGNQTPSSNVLQVKSMEKRIQWIWQKKKWANGMLTIQNESVIFTSVDNPTKNFTTPISDVSSITFDFNVFWLTLKNHTKKYFVMGDPLKMAKGMAPGMLLTYDAGATATQGAYDAASEELGVASAWAHILTEKGVSIEEPHQKTQRFLRNFVLVLLALFFIIVLYLRFVANPLK